MAFFLSLKKRFRKISNALITKAVMKDIEKNIPNKKNGKQLMTKKKLSFFDFIADKVDKISSTIETILKANERALLEETAQAESLNEELSRASFKGQMGRRYDYSPSIVNHEEYLKNKKIGFKIEKRGDGFYTSNYLNNQIKVTNFESADRRFGGVKITETNGNALHVFDFQPEIEMLKILGYLSDDEEVLYPMLKQGDLVKITSTIHKFQQSPSNGLFGMSAFPYPLSKSTLSGIQTIQEEERSKKHLPLFRDLVVGDTVMFLGFKKFEDKNREHNPGFFRSLVENISAEDIKTKNIFRVKKSYIAEWIVDEKVVTGIFPITSLEKLEKSNEV